MNSRRGRWGGRGGRREGGGERERERSAELFGVSRCPYTPRCPPLLLSCMQILAELAQLAASHAIHFELARGRALAWRVVCAPPVSPGEGAMRKQLHAPWPDIP